MIDNVNLDEFRLELADALNLTTIPLPTPTQLLAAVVDLADGPRWRCEVCPL